VDKSLILVDQFPPLSCTLGNITWICNCTLLGTML